MTPERSREAVERLFAAKNSGSADRLLEHFSRVSMSYSDATLGRRTLGWDRYLASMRRMMPQWGVGRSYPLQILAGARSAVVALSDTPELFGDEIRAVAAVDLDQSGCVTRWVDYWDSAAFDRATFNRLKAPDTAWPEDFGPVGPEPEDVVARRYAALHAAVTGGAPAAALFAYDAVWEDWALKTRLMGGKAIAAMLERVHDSAPYGSGAAFRHALGGEAGGGYEWIARPNCGVRAGVTLVEFLDDGTIARAAAVYDGAQMNAGLHQDLISASVVRVDAD